MTGESPPPSSLAAFLRQAWSSARRRPASSLGWFALFLVAGLGTQAGQLALIGVTAFAVVSGMVWAIGSLAKAVRSLRS